MGSEATAGLDDSAGFWTPSPADVLEHLPERIGNYRIRGLVGVGGMGVVYLAEQDDPPRTVALKVMNGARLSSEARRRFHREVHVLNHLRHPGIAQIFDAGTADTGAVPQPYFAMEYVEGQPLTVYARDQRLAVRQRLSLLSRVCRSVEYAHQNGIIHRDLKPANIVVTPSGEPKVLDFGVARATDADIEVTTLHTGVGQLIGTIPYMSPEQVEGDPRELDVRTDVYALGIIGYELLTGRLPYEVHHRTVPEALRIIREYDPLRLSSVDKALQGDLETLIEKAIEKDRSRRYPTAASLADDIERFLRDEPILARAPSRRYQARKFMKRHKALVASFSGVFLALVVGMATTGWQAYQATLERRRAEQEAAISREISDFLHTMLASADPNAVDGGSVTVRQVLDEASRRLEESMGERPRVCASLHQTIGGAYRALGVYERAEHHLRSAMTLHRSLYGEESTEAADSANELANLLYFRGEYAEAETLHREALATRRRVLGPDHPDVATALNDLGAVLAAKPDAYEAERMFREALAIRRKAYGNEDLAVATSLGNVATMVANRGDHAASAALLREALAIHRNLLGPEHPYVANILNNLAFRLHAMGDLEGAEPLYRETLAMRRRLLGDSHPDVATSLNNLAALLRSQGKYEAARVHAQEGLEIRRTSLQPSHPHIARSLRLLGQIAMEQKRYADAEPLFRECFEIRRKSLPEENPLIAEARSAWGESIAKQGRYEQAEPLVIESYQPIRKSRGDGHKRTTEALKRIVDLYQAWGKHELAARWQAELPE